MAKSLKEALLEQMAALQERGLAPGEIPAEQEEEPSYTQYEGEAERRSTGRERDNEPRRGSGGRAPRVRSRAPELRRERRELREPRGGRERRPSRESRESRELLAPPELIGPPPAAPPRPSPPPRPVGQAGPERPRFAGPRPAPRSDMLRRNAERLQREQAERNQIGELLTAYSGQEADGAAMEEFFSKLATETGALPPFNVVLEALRGAGSADPAEVGNQVRLYYRRARSRVAPTPAAAG